MTAFIYTLVLAAKQHTSMAMYLPAFITMPMPYLSIPLTLLAFAITTHQAAEATPIPSRWAFWRKKHEC